MDSSHTGALLKREKEDNESSVDLTLFDIDDDKFSVDITIFDTKDDCCHHIEKVSTSI
jgi:hypothetical protein